MPLPDLPEFLPVRMVIRHVRTALVLGFVLGVTAGACGFVVVASWFR